MREEGKEERTPRGVTTPLEPPPETRRCSVIEAAKAVPAPSASVAWALGPTAVRAKALMSHIVKATLWRSPVQLVGLASKCRLVMGVSLGGLPPVSARIHPPVGFRNGGGGMPRSVPGPVPVDDA